MAVVRICSTALVPTRLEIFPATLCDNLNCNSLVGEQQTSLYVCELLELKMKFNCFVK